MSLELLAPANTQNSRATAQSAFARFLKEQEVNALHVHSSIDCDATGARLVAVMDRFGLFLARQTASDGNFLAPGTVMAYYRHVKLTLLGRYPLQKAATDDILLSKGKMLEKYCKKRVEGTFIQKAPSCTQDDLTMLQESIYTAGNSLRDYQDAALLCLMWHCFGRASDLAFVQKQHLSMAPDGAVFVRLLRVKTSQEQGLTLVPARADYLACPLTALALALAMQESPSMSLLSQMPKLIAPVAVAADPSVSLFELLDASPDEISGTATDAARAPSRVKAEVGIHGYINRILRRVQLPPQATRGLTSHSFRRGGAQHADANDRLASQWIMDRGAWNMSATNKMYAYVFNTPKEDRKVARVLSGWSADDKAQTICLQALDSSIRAELAKLQSLLYSACSGHNDRRLNVDNAVMGIHTATLVQHLPVLKALGADSTIIQRIDACAVAAEVAPVELVAWSEALRRIVEPEITEDAAVDEPKTLAK